MELEHQLLTAGVTPTEWKDRPICVDFDGVLHQYMTPWEGPEIIPDGPIEGAIPWLHEMVKHFTVHIFSVRSTWPEGILAMQEWLEEHGAPVEQLSFPTEKPYAGIYLDDRGWRFEGEYPSVDEINSFTPWKPSTCPTPVSR